MTTALFRVAVQIQRAKYERVKVGQVVRGNESIQKGWEGWKDRVSAVLYCRFSRGFDGAVAMLRACNSDWRYSNERGKHLKRKLVGIYVYRALYISLGMQMRIHHCQKNMDNRVFSALIHIYSTEVIFLKE